MSQSALCIRWPKYWSLNFSTSPSNEHSGLISFRMDWSYSLAVQGTLQSLLQYHSSKASVLRHSAFFIVQLSHPYMTTGKTTALTRRIFAGEGQSRSILTQRKGVNDHSPLTTPCPSMTHIYYLKGKSRPREYVDPRSHKNHW